MTASEPNPAQRMRLDKWLWAARFYKTRSLASDEIQKGRVMINGQRAKPARPLQVGDCISIEKQQFVYELTVDALSDKRGPASVARELYTESEQSAATRAETAKRLSADRVVMRGLAGEGRPSKRQRRQIIRFRNNSDAGKD